MLFSMTTPSRRACLKLLLAAGVLRPANGGSGSFQRYYQATAVITFLGVTIFQKKDVGGGYAVAEEAPQGGNTRVALQFAGGSWPAKAHGINRLGYIKEVLVEAAGGAPLEAQYYGFMTSSGEKDFSEAKRSLSESRQSFVDPAAKPVPYSATEGVAGPGAWTFSLSRLLMPARWTFTDCGQLNTQVKAAMAADRDPVKTEHRFAGGAVPNTFLNSLRHALRDARESTSHQLVYNGKSFRMHCVKQHDGRLLRLNGTLEEASTGHVTPFRLWYERDSPNYLPVRIEYKAKSFLRLVFEMNPHWEGPSPSYLFNKENA